MRRTWSPTRVASGVGLVAWAAAFWFLLVSGRTQLYLGSRTEWVVPLGAVALTLAAAGRLWTARTTHRERLRPRDAWGFAVVALPAVLVLALPPTSLSSFAASRRSASAGFVSTTGDPSSGDITLVDVASADWSTEGQRALVRRAGEQVSFVGFVTERPGLPADEFYLTRFIVSCCVADALSVQVRVVEAPPGRFQQDQWVRVDGAIYPVAGEVIVAATNVEPVPEPADPYLNP
ncbi:MAG TPA: TIGR03943 family protein [Actinomycetota bacterium]|nr:TIGR03943 family protein [Actinomycetota bacterium]